MGTREVILFIERYVAIPFVGWLVAQGFIGQEDTAQITEVISHLTAFFIMALLYLITAKKTTPEQPLGTPRFARINALAGSVKTFFIQRFTQFAFKKPVASSESTPQNPV